MNQQCLCDYSSEELSEDKKDEGGGAKTEANRIFLNFTREYRHPAKDRYNQEKVKELFKYLRERSDLQEMKVSGWLDGKEEAEDDEGSKRDEDSRVADEEDDDVDVDADADVDDDDDDDDECKNVDDTSYFEEESSRRGGGQRFAMSRDFWYRKLNTLKAQKLDEAALEAEDVPPNDDSKPPKCVRYIKNEKVYADEVPQSKEDMFADMEKFDAEIGRPVEKSLKTKFVNVYDNREFLRKDSE